MNRDEARKKAQELVSKMTLEEKASQLKYDAPPVDQRYKNRFGFDLGKACINFSGRPIVPISTSRPPFWSCLLYTSCD